MEALTGIEQGMSVLDRDGKPAGVVLALVEGRLHVVRGWLTARDYVCPQASIAEVQGDRVVLSCPRSKLVRASVAAEHHYLLEGSDFGFLPEQDTVNLGPSRALAGVRRRLRRLGRRLRH